MFSKKRGKKQMATVPSEDSETVAFLDVQINGFI